MNEDHNNAELETLVDGYLEGQLTDGELKRLNSLIESSETARQRYWELAIVHGLLEQGLQSASVKAAGGEHPAVATVKKANRPKWPGLAAAAAGVVIGVFSASMVWAYRGSQRETEVRAEVLFESFESDEPRPLVRLFPDQAGRWFGDLEVGARPNDGLEPERGESVAKFIPVSTRKYSYARYLIDVEDLPLTELGDFSQLEVKASFASDQTTVPVRYQIRLAAFAEAPEEIRAIWNRESLLFDTVLQHTARNFLAKPHREGWRKLTSRIELPPGSRSVVISLGVAGQEGAAPSGGHYLDAVRVRLISSRAPQG